MDAHEVFRNMRTAFATLYPDEASAHRIVDDIGLDATLIAFSAQAQNSWQMILREAAKNRKIDDLLKIALNEYPANVPLSSIINAYYKLPENEINSRFFANFCEDSPLINNLQPDKTNLSNSIGSLTIGKSQGHIITAAGKNIVQVGNLNIPYWLLTFAAFVAVAVTMSYFYFEMSARQQLTRSEDQVRQISNVVLATPTLTPLPTPVRMPDGQFNVAIAELKAVNEKGSRILPTDTFDLAVSMAKFLDNSEGVWTEILGEQVQIWGPDKGITSVASGEEEAFAKLLNADVLIYGELIIVDNGNWQIKPKFFLTTEIVGQATELQGEYALGSPILYRPDNPASKKDANFTLRQRVEVLSELMIGLAYMSFGDSEGYKQATTTFENIQSRSEWIQGDNHSGQEILYLFLGNSYLVQSSLTQDSTDRTVLLQKSRSAFESSIAINSNYRRSYNGLGSALFQIARPLLTEDECKWNQKLLALSAENYQAALNIQKESTAKSGQVEYRATFGLARVHFWRGYCFTPDEWNEAETTYISVVKQYDSYHDPLTDLTDIAVYAYTDLAFINFLKSEHLANDGDTSSEQQRGKLLQTAIGYYARVFELTNLSGTEGVKNHAKEVMSYYLTALCIDKQSKRAREELENFTTHFQSRGDVRTYILNLVDRTLWEACYHEGI